MDQVSWNACHLVIVNYEEEKGKHPLCLAISETHARHLQHGGSDNSLVACLRLRRQGGHDIRQLVVVEVVADGRLAETDQTAQHHVRLYATHIFARHYDLHSSLNLAIRQIASVPTLSHVTLSAATDDSFRWLQGWYDRLLLSVIRQPVLCRQGDVPVCSVTGEEGAAINDSLGHLLELRVLDCQPTRQGVLGPDTAITVVKASAIFRQEDERQPESDTGQRNSIAARPSAVSAQMPLVVLLATLLLPHYKSRQSPSFHTTMNLLTLAARLSSSWKATLRVQVLPRPPLLVGSELCLLLDSFQLVFVTSTFLARHRLPDLSWVTAGLRRGSLKVEAMSPNTQFKDDELIGNRVGGHGGRRWVRLCAIEPHSHEIDFSSFGEISEDVAYVTPLLWFNFNLRPSKLIDPEARLVIKKFSFDPAQCKSSCAEQKLKCRATPAFASSVHVSLVNSVAMANAIPDCYTLLSKYFAVPRLICQGDIFCMASTDDPTNVFYFHVIKICGSSDSQDHGLGFLVDKVNSTLYQEGPAQAYVPISMEMYFSAQPLHPIWNSPVPSGFSKLCDQLSRLIFPYLRSTQLRSSASPTLCLTGAPGSGKTLLLRSITKLLNLQMHTVNCHEVMGESSGANETRIKAVCLKATSFSPCLLVFRNVHVIGQDNDGVTGESRSANALQTSLNEMFRSFNHHPVFVVGITTDKSLLSTELASVFLHHFHIESPNSGERYEILKSLLEDVNCSLQVSLKHLVKKTSGFFLGDLSALVSRAVAAAYQRVHGICYLKFCPTTSEEEVDLCLTGVQIFDNDFDTAFAHLQSAQSDAIGAPKIPDVTWKDVGGLEYVKSEIMDTVQLPLEHPELLASGLRRSGILLYGAPGCGKTLLAKAVASECSLNFLSIKGPELINMYVGQSEENVRKVFQRARSASPCIIFFDELDSLAPNRGRSGDSGGVMDRVVSQLLAELDGLHRSTDVFVMAATNRPDLIDPALLRPGRFDKLLCVGVSHDSRSQLKILEALTRKFHLSEDLSLAEFVERCPKHLSGADFYALCSDALLIAMSRRIQQLECDSSADKQEDLVVSKDDFDEALNNLTPSLSLEEIQRYGDIKNKIMR